jgi:hypothetical protein
MTKARDIASAAPAPSTVSATELGYLDGVTSAIQTQVDAKTAKSTLTTTGDIYYASAANTPARLGIGSTGNVLTVASGVPSWAAPAGGGKVLQVVQGSTTTSTTIATTSMTDTTLSATITPSSATSKILVLVVQFSRITRDDGFARFMNMDLVRGVTGISGYGNEGWGFSSNVNGNNPVVLNYLDSPSTTSATTYKTMAAVNGSTSGSHQIVMQANSMVSTITLIEIGA